MLKLFYCKYKNQFLNSKNHFFSIIEFSCITITTGIHNFMRVKMYMICVVVMKNEYIHVRTKKLKGVNFQLHIPHLKNYAKC